MTTKKPRQKTLRCPSCGHPIEEVVTLHTVRERWFVCREEDGTLSAHRRCDTIGYTEYVEFVDCGCSFSEEEIEKVRPILKALEAIEG
jgi:hypothetical protein